MRNFTLPLSLTLMLWPIAAGAAAPRPPVAVSPGMPDRFAPAAGGCPTFAWANPHPAASLELLVYEVPEPLEGTDSGLTTPALRVTLPGAATSWTPPSDSCLEPGRRYSWLIRSGTAGRERGRVSEPRLFAVPAAPAAPDVRQALRVLSEYLAATGGEAPLASGGGQADGNDRGGAAARPRGAPAAGLLAPFTAALSADQPAGAGTAHGIVGVTNSAGGAGLAGDNTAGGADLLLGAAVAGEAAALTEQDLVRSSAGDLVFDFRNDGAGAMTLRVDSTDVLTTATGAAATHGHPGEDITSGTVAEPRIDGALARDGEILPTVLAGDGDGSGLDADLLDGSDSSLFAPAAGSPSYVAKGGDTMTGTLTLSPAASAALLTTAGAAGFGTASPDKPFHAVGLGAIFNNADVATPITAPFFSIETDQYSTTSGLVSILDRRQQTGASKTPTLLVQNTHASTTATNPLFEARAAGATRMLLQQDGNLGLHTATPSHPFHLKKFLNGAHLIASIENTGPFSAAALQLKTPAAGNEWALAAQETGAGSARGLEVQNASFATPPWSIAAATGFVGINNLTPANQLDVKGDIRVGTGTSGCVKDADGTTIAGVCSSDARLKRNIAPLSDLLGRVTRLTPVHFNWRSDEYPELVLGDEIQTGLVAQQVAKVLPELVVEDEDGFLRVRYNELPLLLLQALKEQQEQTQRLERRVRELAAQLAELEPGKPSA